ncbi:MAG: acetyl-CoA decarbonylase/synthase complex subunit delta [Candidatus Omnitrophota bacterium]|nr:acetyl-CoA decarbonylase/synthase complex subunit delta [Candidatus Omnitrophota bacterium]
MLSQIWRKNIMPIELVKEKYSGAINTVEIGKGDKAVRIGGETTLPFLFEEGDMPHKPVVALEVFDTEPFNATAEFAPPLLYVRLQAIHPDYGNRSADEAIAMVKAAYQKTGVPLIIAGCGDAEKDNEVLPKVSQAFKGENFLFGIATQSNYKTLAATALADGHSIIAESPIDINIAKQLNILISDMGFDPARIVMHPTTTSLGYGMEYVYSIMERGRLAAFIGDKMLSMPFILFVGQEVWKTKEAKEFGEGQGINWELATAISMLQAGADILVLRHPHTVTAVTKYIEMAMDRGKQ